MFEEAWNQEGLSTAVGRVRAVMRDLGLDLAKDMMGSAAPPGREARKRWLHKYLGEMVWPAVRAAEREEWWDPHAAKADHGRYLSWGPSESGLDIV